MLRSVCESHDSRRVPVEGFVPSGEPPPKDVIDAGEHTETVPKIWLAFHLENFVQTEMIGDAARKFPDSIAFIFDV